MKGGLKRVVYQNLKHGTQHTVTATPDAYHRLREREAEGEIQLLEITPILTEEKNI